jgi:hypothetical protein
MANLDAIVEEFAEHVAAQTDAIRQGDAKTGNQHAGGTLLRSTNCAQLVTLGVTRFCGCSTMKGLT